MSEIISQSVSLIGRSLEGALTASFILPLAGTIAIFVYVWWARRRALAD